MVWVTVFSPPKWMVWYTNWTHFWEKCRNILNFTGKHSKMNRSIQIVMPIVIKSYNFRLINPNMNPWFQTVFPGKKKNKKHQVSAAAQNALASALGVAPEALSWESQRQQSNVSTRLVAWSLLWQKFSSLFSSMLFGGGLYCGKFFPDVF